MEQENQQRHPKKSRRSASTLLKVVLWIVGILILMSFVLHIPVVQQWSIRKLSGYLTNRLDTEVKVSRVDFNIFRHLTLNDLMIEDPYQKGDTILYTERIHLRFRNLFSLLNNSLTLQNVNLADARLHIKRREDENTTNLSLLLSRLQSPDLNTSPREETRDRKNLVLNFRNFMLERAHLLYEDHQNGQTINGFLPQTELGIRKLNFETHQLLARDIRLEQPIITVKNIENRPPTERENALNAIFNRSALWNLTIERLTILDGSFSIADTINQSGSKRIGGLDFRNLELTQVRVVVDDINFNDGVLNTKLPQISFHEETSGFILDKMSAGDMHIDSGSIRLNQLVLLSEHSLLKDSLSLTFEDFSAFGHFADEVSIRANFTDSRVGYRDIIYFAPQLQSNPFFIENRNDFIRLNANIQGRLNRIRVEDLSLATGDILLAGEFRARDITIPGQELINLDLQQANFPIQVLEKIVSGLALPPQFNMLGRIHFSGNYDGFFKDFVAYGNIRANIGRADVDMRLNLREGREKATYSGNLELIDFELGKWSGNPDLGKINAILEVQEGIGLMEEAATARLVGNVSRLGFKGYQYRNIVLNGKLEKNHFDGEAAINEENIDLVFSGRVDFSDSIPSYSFESTIDTLDLQALHLTGQPLSLSGVFDVDARGNSLESITGTGIIHDLHLSKGPAETYHLDSIRIESVMPAPGIQKLTVESEIVEGYIKGQFKLMELPDVFLYELKQSYPQLLSTLEVKDTTFSIHEVTFDLYFKEPQNWIEFAGLEAIFAQDLDINGHFAYPQGIISIDFKALAFGYKNYNFYGIDGTLSKSGNSGQLDLEVVAADISERFIFEEISLEANLRDTLIAFNLGMTHVGDFFDTLRIPGDIAISENAYRIHLAPEDVRILDRSWVLATDNKIVISKDTLILEGLSFESGEQYFTLDNYLENGLQLEVGGFDANLLNEVWDYEKLMFAGQYDMFFRVADLSAFSGIDFNLNISELTINEESYGTLDVNARSKKNNPSLDVDVQLIRDDMQLTAVGAYVPPFKHVDSLDRNYMDLDITMSSFPLEFFEFILGDGIHETEGAVNGSITLSGYLNELNMEGQAIIANAATTIDVLGTRYYFDQQEIILTNSMVDATGAVIRDARGATALVTGGLTHNRFKNFGLDARIRGTDILLINTTKKNNPVFYGDIYGTVDVQFFGSMIRPNIVVNGSTALASYIAIPLDVSTASSESEFLQFVNDKDGDTTSLAVNSRESVQITGVSLEIDATINESATIELIFDEKSGDIIRCTGNGNIRMILTRDGEFFMYGSYEISEGTYLFTSNKVINKPFIIRTGSTIQWSGDPFEAQIRVKADYVGLKTSLSTFLAEYLTTDQLKEEASEKTEVNLTLILTGSLQSPEINFDISFPEVSGELSGYINSKMRILESNQNAMNEQVFGLLWTGTFLPSNAFSLGGTNQSSIADAALYNTLSEFIASQASRILSSLLQGAFSNVGFISGIDVDLGVGWKESFELPDENFKYEEYEFSLKNRLFNDRILLDVGGNYVTDAPVAGAYFAGDFAIEYALTKDRRLKVRFSHRNDLTIEGNKKYKYGIGLSYRREFDSFEELFKRVRKDLQEAERDLDEGSR